MKVYIPTGTLGLNDTDECRLRAILSAYGLELTHEVIEMPWDKNGQLVFAWAGQVARGLAGLRRMIDAGELQPREDDDEAILVVDRPGAQGILQDFLANGWAISHHLSGGRVCSDASCFRCRLAAVLLDVEAGSVEGLPEIDSAVMPLTWPEKD